MTTALIMMKALPLTTGHTDLIAFAAHYADRVVVFNDSINGEPFINERAEAISKVSGVDRLIHRHGLPQDPQEPLFWTSWTTILISEFRDEPIDFVVGIEAYCKTVAKILGAKFVPFDMYREMNSAKGTDIRNNPLDFWYDIAPEFQPALKTKIAVVGAESTGKTTFSKMLAEDVVVQGDWVLEYARPYLETIGTDITVDSMTDIWKGQAALMRQKIASPGSHTIVFDTDLSSTVGYWEQPHWAETLGPVPSGLRKDFQQLRPDLYIVLRSNIPFEEDSIRYGGDRRESSDEYWIRKTPGPKIVLDSSDNFDRVLESLPAIRRVRRAKINQLNYVRTYQ